VAIWGELEYDEADEVYAGEHDAVRITVTREAWGEAYHVMMRRGIDHRRWLPQLYDVGTWLADATLRGLDGKEQGVALYNVAQLDEATGRLDEAERLHRESLAIGYGCNARKIPPIRWPNSAASWWSTIAIGMRAAICSMTRSPSLPALGCLASSGHGRRPSGWDARSPAVPPASWPTLCWGCLGVRASLDIASASPVLTRYPRATLGVRGATCRRAPPRAGDAGSTHEACPARRSCIQRENSVRLLTINTGSSSLKVAQYAVYAVGDAWSRETRLLDASMERIGQPGGRMRISVAGGAMVAKATTDERRDLPDHAAALRVVLDQLGRSNVGGRPDAVGHRVVHGGAEYREPALITPQVLDTLRRLVPIDPDHMPLALAAIEVIGQAYPSISQVACFDTAFHRDMPRVAQTYALPRELWDEGVRRYGFHGLSYEYILDALRAEDAAAAHGRVIAAHLGNGASMAAITGGVSIETTMGFTPTGGMVMGTRPGDLDPGVSLYLLQAKGMTPDALSRLVNQQAGLLGLSGASGDMQDLLGREASDPRAAEAVALFCYTAKKYLGALAAVLGGLDTLVFTAGIGENAAPVRECICAGLDFLGIRLDPARNAAHAPIISAEGSPVVVRVMRTDEDLMIARHTYRFLRRTGGTNVSV
jgi:acetate kinase